MQELRRLFDLLLKSNGFAVTDIHGNACEVVGLQVYEGRWYVNILDNSRKLRSCEVADFWKEYKED